MSACQPGSSPKGYTVLSTAGTTGQGAQTVTTQNAVGQADPEPRDAQCPATSADPAVAKLKANPAEIPLPAGFHPVRVVRCVSESHMISGDGEWQYVDAQTADSALAPFLAALKLPSETPPAGNYACTAVGILIPPFALVDASGAIVHPKLPMSYCNAPLPQVLNTLRDLPWRTETEQKLNQIQTQLEVDTGCPSPYKDMFEFPVLGTPVPWDKTRALANPAPTAVCSYTASGTGTDAVGTLAQGVKLTSAQQSAISRALAQSEQAAAPACSTRATRFALLTGPNSIGLMIELDGCHRINWPDEFKSTASASLLSTLAAAGIS
jgi:hypothetical protein